MPTIDDLPAALSVSDTDEIAVSQSAITRKATRAQFLSGVQSALSLGNGMLLGRATAGNGSPEPIVVGDNLTLTNATLSAPAAFAIANLPSGAPPASTDLVPIGQDGQNSVTSCAALLGVISAVPGIDGSNFVAAAAGGVGTRRLADLLGDAISIESFGACGDGVTDDTAAFASASLSGRPLRLGAKTYSIAQPLTFSQSAVLIGVAGMTVLQRPIGSTATSWITFDAQNAHGWGVIFDAGQLLALPGPAVTISAGCQTATFEACQFTGASGAEAGHGMLVNGAETGQFAFANCTFSGNAANGLAVNSGSFVSVTDSCANRNSGNGISVAADTSCTLTGNTCAANVNGMTVGNWLGPVAALGAAVQCMISGNTCSTNTQYGTCVGGSGAVVSGNFLASNGTVASGGGLVARLVASRVMGNTVSGGSIGIDARSCLTSIFSDNHISNCGIGLLAGSGQYLHITCNYLLQNSWAVSISAFEPALTLDPTGPISFTQNWLGFSSPLGGGLRVQDGAQGISVTDNDFNGWGGADVSQALWLHTDSAVVRGNRWNNTAQFPISANSVGGSYSIVFPDVVDVIFVTNAAQNIISVMSSHQVDVLGQITFIRVTAGGAGYNNATISIAGDGVGATAQAICANGQVIGAMVVTAGSGYGATGSSAAVTIAGDGAGATASAYVGLPVLSGRALNIGCSCQTRFVADTAPSSNSSWAAYNITVPAFGSASFLGAFGVWCVTDSPPVDYVQPTGNGGAILQTVDGADLFLRPSAGGALHIASANETFGCTSSVGRGSPLGAVSAPPGSDYRNLDGGGGNTFWVKNSGTDASGWVALA